MSNNGFEGWYFKHQKDNNTIAFIPGKAESGAFIQMIFPGGSKRFDVPEISVKNCVITAGKCKFSMRGCKIDLPGVNGEILYGRSTPLGSDIMGPFRFFKMECRHSVISMSHTLNGSLNINGIQYNFNNGSGYIEKDSGTSFPRRYTWLQCNSFSKPCSVMASIADIPFFGINFKGCICAVIYNNREYRFATYNGVRIRTANSRRICLSQRNLLLKIDIMPSSGGHPLKSPVMGKMSGTIHESLNANIRVRLWNYKKLLFDLHSSNAAYEFVPDTK